MCELIEAATFYGADSIMTMVLNDTDELSTDLKFGRHTVAEIPAYDIAAIVAGSRTINDYARFSEIMGDIVAYDYYHDKSIVFITGKARTGADAMIIKWCKEHGYPWVEMPADWDEYGKRAGYIRNEQMAEVANTLFAFYDGVSKGTKHMINLAKSEHLDYKVFILDPDSEKGKLDAYR